jgi:rhamnose transport system permease protein
MVAAKSYHMLQRYRREVSVAIAILILSIVLLFAAPGFFSAQNQTDLLLTNMPVLIVALGMTLVILSGQIDISVGSVFAICSVASGEFAKIGLPTPAAGIAACAVGAALGALNGALVAYLRIPSIVVTLAAMVALRDGLRWATQGAWVQNLPRNFQWFGLSQPASQTLTFLIAAALLAAVAWGLRHIAAGRAIYATGSNENAARLVGINSELVTFSVFAVTGALTGCAALLNSVRFSQIPSNAGLGLELKVIAAVVVGGVSITGGKGTILGTLLGLILLGMTGPALTFLGVSAYWERAIQGAIILAAVSIDAVRIHSRRHAGVA